jgi:hypothetical protein
MQGPVSRGAKLPASQTPDRQGRLASRSQRQDIWHAASACARVAAGGRYRSHAAKAATMELGVDISALNAVYMRDMPPTRRITRSSLAAPDGRARQP